MAWAPALETKWPYADVMKDKKLLAVVAASIRAYRKQRGLTIEGLAEKASSDSGSIGHIETMTRSPSLAMLARISAALDVAPGDLLVDPSSTSKDALGSRFLTLFKGLGRQEQADLLAILSKRNLAKELKALRLLLRA